jgi:cell division protein FtsN
MIVIATDGQYKVHLRTFRNLKTAEQYREKVASIGKKIEVVPWKVTPEETWYRVMTEPFTAKDDASKFIEETKR